MATKTKFDALRTTTIERAVETTRDRFFGDKIADWKLAHLTELATIAFDAAVAFGYVQGKPATAINGKSHIAGYWVQGEHTDGFEDTWNQATELLNKVVNFNQETMLVASGGTRMALSALIVEEILDNIHMDDRFIVKPEDEFAL